LLLLFYTVEEEGEPAARLLYRRLAPNCTGTRHGSTVGSKPLPMELQQKAKSGKI
jgi:hypothetical protein